MAREAAGTGLGVRIIEWTVRSYERAGFEHVTDPPEVKWPTSLYQRRTGG